MADPLKEVWDYLERVSPTSLAARIDRDRPYDGQPQTDDGERGKTLVEGLTFRDIQDCFIRGCYEASGLPIEKWPGTVYDLPWKDMDIIAVAQNMSCNMEKYMGIYPNVQRLLPANPREDHWCGPKLEGSTWQSHDDDCDNPTNIKEGNFD